MKFLVCSKLSEHRYKTPEGYLVCVDSILSRTGKQTYSRDELFKDGCTDEVEVERSAEEVFSEKTLASFENKPLTIEHPEEDVTPANHNKYSVGFIRDIKRGKDGSEDVMLGTIVVTDAEAIELIETGKLKELSCGYDCDIEDEDNPQQRNIRGNHVALCEKGRAGIARIVDSKCKDTVIKTVSLRGSIQRGDIGKLQFNLINASKCWISIEGLYQDDKSGLINISGRSECVLVKKNGGLTVNVQYVVEKQKSRAFEKVEHRVETSTDFWKDDVIDFVEKTFDKVLNSVKAKDSMCDARIKVANLTNGYAIVPASRWRKFGLNSEVERFTTNLDEARYIRSSLERNDGISFVIVDVTQRRTTDSVKDEQLYAVEFSYDGDSWSNYLGHVNVRAKSEQDALTKAKRWAVEHYDNPGFFKIASTKYTNVETIDSVKDTKFEICYVDNGDVCISIEAKDENDARQKFRRRYGMYYIKHIRKVKDGVKDMKVSHDNIREQPVFVMQSDVDKNLFFYIGKTHAMKEGEFTYAQYDMEGMTPDELRKELEANGWHKVARGPAPFIDEANIYAVKARYEGTVLEWYVRANSEKEAFDKVKRQPGHNYDRFVSAKIVNERAGMHIIDEDPYEESTKGLEEAEKNLHDEMICNTETDCKDAKTEYVFNYHDTYHGTRDKMRVDANNLDEAIRKFGNAMALGGFGTANIYVISVSPNDGYMRAYGKLSEMLKQKWTRDSVKKLDSKKLLSIVKAAKSIKK